MLPIPDESRSDRHRSAGFTLVELLVVVAVIGVVSMIAAPNLLNALDRGKQRRTMADLRTLGTALETYNTDHSNYPSASSISELRSVTEPVYVRKVPLKDGWGRDFIVDASTSLYTLGSGGKDGGSLDYVGGPTTDFDDAIIFVNGQFVQWPEGSQE